MAKQSILITGCSSGIGLHAAKYLKEQGWRVFPTARKPEDIKKLTELGFEAIPMDMDDTTSIHEGVQKVIEATGGTLDAVFNNAGILIAGAVEDLTDDLIKQQFSTKRPWAAGTNPRSLADHA